MHSFATELKINCYTCGIIFNVGCLKFYINRHNLLKILGISMALLVVFILILDIFISPSVFVTGTPSDDSTLQEPSVSWIKNIISSSNVKTIVHDYFPAIIVVLAVYELCLGAVSYYLSIYQFQFRR